MTANRWVSGVEPLPEQPQLAAAIREVVALSLQLEQSCPELGELLAAVESVRAKLRARVPADLLPRVGTRTEGRAYIEHAYDPGSFNPMFPRYEIEIESATTASGTVTFPVCYEGGPGIVHGGFLAVFVDVVVQHHNCEIGQSGKTRGMELKFRRPVPLATPLRFEIDRATDDTSITSAVRLYCKDELLCIATTPAVATDPTNVLHFSPRS